MRRTRLALVGVCALGGAVRAEEPAEPPACVVPAFLEANDAGLWATYDGIRRGLEEASLPRVCRQDVPSDEAGWSSALAAGKAAGAPLVFAVGRPSMARCAARFRETAPAERPLCVYVDTALVGTEATYPAAPDVPLPAAVVRAEVPLQRWRDLAHGLLGADRPPVRRPVDDLPGGLPDILAREAVLEAVAATLEVDLAPPERARVAFDWGEGTPFGRVPTGDALPILSSDRSRFGRDACAVVVPEHGRLGRLAAEAARRLQAGEGRDRALRLALRGGEIWVDLGACDRAGLAPPLTFLASVDRLRRGTPAEEAPR